MARNHGPGLMNQLRSSQSTRTLEHRFETNEALVRELAEDILRTLQSGIVNRGQALCIFPGGSTPISLYQHLAKQEFPWEKVTVMLSDERRLPVGHPERNEFMLRQHLLKDHARKIEFIPYLDCDKIEETSNLRSSKVLDTLANSIDFVLLGMGHDGHIASLFPNCTQSAIGLDPLQSHPFVLTTSPVPPLERISLSLQVLMSSEHLAIYLTGHNKWQFYEEQKNRSECTQGLPIWKLLNNSKNPIDIYWSALT